MSGEQLNPREADAPEPGVSGAASPTPIRPAAGAPAPDREGRESAEPGGYTVRQAAAELQVSMATIRRWMRDGTLPSAPAAGGARIPEDAFGRARRLVNAGRKGARAQGDDIAALNDPLNDLAAEVLALRREVVGLRASLLSDLRANSPAGAARTAWMPSRAASPNARWGDPESRRTAVGIRADTLRAARSAERLDRWERLRTRVDQLRQVAETELRRQVALARVRRPVAPAGAVAMRGYDAERPRTPADNEPDARRHADAQLDARAS